MNIIIAKNIYVYLKLKLIKKRGIKRGRRTPYFLDVIRVYFGESKQIHVNVNFG